MNHFNYYIFIDYSENFIGYIIVANVKIKELIPKISRFRHYREADYKKIYIKNIKNTFKRERITDYLLKYKIKEMRQNLEIFSDVISFLKDNSDILIFVSIDDRQYSSFEKLVSIVDGNNITIVKESALKRGSQEFMLSLILDNLLNIQRLENER